MLFGKIKALVEYGVRTGLIEAEDTSRTVRRPAIYLTRN